MIRENRTVPLKRSELRSVSQQEIMTWRSYSLVTHRCFWPATRMISSMSTSWRSISHRCSNWRFLSWSPAMVRRWPFNPDFPFTSRVTTRFSAWSGPRNILLYSEDRSDIWLAANFFTCFAARFMTATIFFLIRHLRLPETTYRWSCSMQL